MDDNNKISFENKINNNFFKILVREYLSNSLNAFEILRGVVKIIFSRVSKLVKLKYISVKLIFVLIYKDI